MTSSILSEEHDEGDEGYEGQRHGEEDQAVEAPGFCKDATKAVAQELTVGVPVEVTPTIQP